jgi:predicted alpha/beta hydrolase family esterase
LGNYLSIITNNFLSGIATNNQGIILVEAASPTTQPLVLTIYHGTNQIAQTQLYLSISGVEQMFRHKNLLINIPPAMPDRLTDASVPNEPDTGAKNFVFVHGYNVNPTQARGWDADFYKRMYWSGSHAKFYAVTWEASDSQWLNQVTVNLQTNIVNAFLTASNLATFIGTLPNQTVVAAHSLGNMAVLSALNDCTNINFNINTFFMIDAAVAMEAIQGTASEDVNLIYPDWIPYANKLYASFWWQLFPTNDARHALTWNNRLANVGNTTLYNFYSSGEEVLREYTNGTPPSELLGSALEVAYTIENEAANIGEPSGSFTWAWQEKLKGRGQFDGVLSSSHGGWKFNTNAPYAYLTNSIITQIPNSQATQITNSQLQTNAFFDVTSPSFGTADLALFGSSGSSYAQLHRNRILSDAIPCLTLPIGANHVGGITPPGQADRNFDMQGQLENGWPPGRAALRFGATAAGEWHHSDCRAVAYPFTHSLFDDMVNFGGLQ